MPGNVKHFYQQVFKSISLLLGQFMYSEIKKSDRKKDKNRSQKLS